jgi:methyl-accepting chemotaxis protein
MNTNNQGKSKILHFLSNIFLSKQAKQDYFDMKSKLDAINQSQAVVEFAMDGTIVDANNNFLDLMGYRLDEVKGHHHGMFVEPAYKASQEYTLFWEKLSRGECEVGEFKRLSKGGNTVWVKGIYNPILDVNGKPFKVIKIALDVTEKKIAEEVAQERRKGLNEVVTNIIAVSEDISVSMEQLNQSATSQASSAIEQATAVTEIGSIVEEITQTSQKTLEQATQLGESAKNNSTEGERGKDVINKVLGAMSQLQKKMLQISETIMALSDKTQKVGEITEAVSDIAMQSKMLALNASIEAAKAGESGKGFAVVADEVKDLANRSQKATEKVQNILQDIMKTAEHAVMVTEDGTKSVDDNLTQAEEAGDIINTLADVIEEASIATQQIVAAVREESVGIEQVLTSIREIDKVTTEFSNATEETKQAIVRLKTVAAVLKESVKKYQVNDDMREV